MFRVANVILISHIGKIKGCGTSKKKKRECDIKKEVRKFGTKEFIWRHYPALVKKVGAIFRPLTKKKILTTFLFLQYKLIVGKI